VYVGVCVSDRVVGVGMRGAKEQSRLKKLREEEYWWEEGKCGG
jgi:hypothetical protein